MASPRTSTYSRILETLAVLTAFPFILPNCQANFLLGPWDQSCLRLHRWYFDPVSMKLFRHDGHVFQIFRQVPTITSRATRLKMTRFIGPQETTSVPHTAVPCSMAIKDGSAQATSDGSYKEPLGTSASMLRADTRKSASSAVNWLGLWAP